MADEKKGERCWEGKWRLVYWFKAQRLQNINPADEHGPVSFCSRLVDDHQEKRFQLASLLPVQRGGPILTFCVLFVFT